MRNLKVYVDNVNRWAKLFGDTEINVNNIDEEAAQRLFQKIDGDLSPENLCCDGELSMAQVRRKAKMLRGTIADLEKLGFTPRNCYEI